MDLLDRSTKPSQLDGVAQTHVLAVVDVFTRKGYLETLVDKRKDTVLEAYQRITKRAGAHPQILSLDKEGATSSSDGAFEAFLDENGDCGAPRGGEERLSRHRWSHVGGWAWSWGAYGSRRSSE